MLFSIPISEHEIITDTPLSVKSLRSFHFVAKKSSCMMATTAIPVVSIVVDGKVIANKLPIYPFLLQKDAGVQSFLSPVVDSRLVAVPIAINTNCSEIKVRTEGLVENSIELVFDCADNSVVEEEFATCFDTITVYDCEQNYNVQLTEAAEKLFVYPYIFHEHYVYNPNFGESMPTNERYVCNMANEGHLLGEIRVGSKDEYMPDFDIALLAPAQLQSWKNVTYSFSHPTTKNVSLAFHEAFIGNCMTVYFIHKKIFR